MPKRGENIRKRKDGRWEARYKKGINEAGVSIYGSVYAKSYREAKIKQQERIQEQQGQKRQETPKEKVLFGDMVNLWLDDNRIKLKRSTEYRYRSLIDAHIIPELGTKSLSDINGTFVNAYLANKLKNGRLNGHGGLSGTYVRSIMLIIQSVLKYAATLQLCNVQSTKIYKPPIAPKELPILSLQDQKKLKAVCLIDIDETKIGILLSLYLGLRIGEVCALEWSDIDFNEKLLHVRKTVSRIKNTTNNETPSTILIIDRPKTPSSFRAIPICSWIIPILLELKSRSQSSYITSRTLNFISPRTFDYRYHKVLRQAQIDSINYHALRHTFATRCIEAGVDVKSLSEMLGHADASITLNTYVHSSIEQKRMQIEKLKI